MIYLLDTNVISETIKKNPDGKVTSFLLQIPMNKIHLSALTIGEIRKGIENLNDQVRKHKIINWLETDLLNRFAGRIINIDSKVADQWGYLTALSNIPVIDGLIAASCMIHNLKLVTRNVRDFERIQGLEIINPWKIY